MFQSTSEVRRKTGPQLRQLSSGRNISFLSHFVLLRSPVIWMRLTHNGEGNLFVHSTVSNVNLTRYTGPAKMFNQTSGHPMAQSSGTKNLTITN